MVRHQTLTLASTGSTPVSPVYKKSPRLNAQGFFYFCLIFLPLWTRLAEKLPQTYQVLATQPLFLPYAKKEPARTGVLPVLLGFIRLAYANFL